MGSARLTKARTRVSVVKNKKRLALPASQPGINHAASYAVSSYVRGEPSKKKRRMSNSEIEREALGMLDVEAVTERERPLLKNGKRTKLAAEQSKRQSAKKALLTICNDVTAAYRNLSNDIDVLKEKGREFMKSKKRYWLAKCQATGKMTEQEFKYEIWDHVREAVRETYMEIQSNPRSGENQDTSNSFAALNSIEPAQKQNEVSKDAEMSGIISGTVKMLQVPQELSEPSNSDFLPSKTVDKFVPPTNYTTKMHNSNSGFEQVPHQDVIRMASSLSNELQAHNTDVDMAEDDELESSREKVAQSSLSHEDSDQQPSRWSHLVVGPYYQPEKRFFFSDWDDFKRV